MPDTPAPRARKSCGVCADDMDMFNQMRAQITQEGAQKAAAAAAAAATAPPRLPAAVALSGAGIAAAASSSSSRTPLSCPPNSQSLGRATWSFLHTMSAYYPDEPSPAQQKRMSSFITDFAFFYPCPPCAEHLQQHLVDHPPPTNSRSALSRFLCNYHNDVNVRLGKKQFNCDRYDERWKDGPDENAGYDCIEEPKPNDE